MPYSTPAAISSSQHIVHHDAEAAWKSLGRRYRPGLPHVEHAKQEQAPWRRSANHAPRASSAIGRSDNHCPATSSITQSLGSFTPRLRAYAPHAQMPASGHKPRAAMASACQPMTAQAPSRKEAPPAMPTVPARTGCHPMPKQVASRVGERRHERQPYGRDGLRGDAFAAAGEAEAVGGGGLDADARDVDARESRRSRARIASRCGEIFGRSQMSVTSTWEMTPPWSRTSAGRVREEQMRRRAAPAFVRGRKMRADIAGSRARPESHRSARAGRHRHRNGLPGRTSCGTFTPHSQT